MTPLTAAVILAGGSGRRLGGADKPSLRIADRSLLQIAIDAVIGGPIVVVGPPRSLPTAVTGVQEDPAGGGPAAAVAAGVAALPQLPDESVVAVVAADLPGIGPLTFARLAAALVAAAPAEADGALLVDAGGRRQYLSGVWRLGRLAEAIGQRPNWHGAPLRELLGSLRAMEVTGAASETADVDTPADWERWQS